MRAKKLKIKRPTMPTIPTFSGGTFVFAVPLVAPSYNVCNARQHWTLRAELARTWYKAVYMIVKPFIGKVSFTYPVRITTRVFKQGRQLDSTNTVVAPKLIEDALVECGLLAGDSPKYVLSNTLYASQKGDNYTLVIIEG